MSNAGPRPSSSAAAPGDGQIPLGAATNDGGSSSSSNDGTRRPLASAPGRLPDGTLLPNTAFSLHELVTGSLSARAWPTESLFFSPTPVSAATPTDPQMAEFLHGILARRHNAIINRKLYKFLDELAIFQARIAPGPGTEKAWMEADAVVEKARGLEKGMGDFLAKLMREKLRPAESAGVAEVCKAQREIVTFPFDIQPPSMSEGEQDKGDFEQRDDGEDNTETENAKDAEGSKGRRSTISDETERKSEQKKKKKKKKKENGGSKDKRNKKREKANLV